MVRLVALLALCAGAGIEGQTAARHEWKTYGNARFGYQICYPEDMFEPQGEAANGDGQTLLAKDGAKLTVYGRNNVLGQSPHEVMVDAAARLGKASYRLVRPPGFVVSGSGKDGGKYYVKAVFSGEQLAVFEITYGAERAAVYKPVIERMAACFEFAAK
jgi:hypothetical protein